MAKILVLDDEEDLRELVIEELTEVGHSTVSFAGGQDALDHLANDTVDLILSDITMPQMSGYQFFRNFKEQFPHYGHIPFIFMTALSDRDNELKGLRLGVDDYITKPIDYDLMLLRVESHLRRRQPAASPAPQTQTQATPDDKAGDPDAAAKLQAILQESGGRVIASRFTTIALDDLRGRIEDLRSDIRNQFLPCVEAAIRAHLISKDVLAITPSNDFLVYFADIDDDEIESKAGQIRDEIWERLFTLTNDAALSNVDVHSNELTLDVHALDEKGVLAEAEKAVQQGNAKERESKKLQLEQIYSFEKMHAIPLLVASGSPSKIKALSFSKKFTDKIKTLSSLGKSDGPFLLECQEKMFERFKEMPNASKAFARSAMLLPLGFPLLRDTELRNGLISLCQNVETSMDLILITEVVNTPDRLKPYEAILKPLPVGRQLQFIELRRPQQVKDMALDQIGVAYVSMSFSDLEACDARERVEFTDELQRQSVKLYIKNIPEGKLSEAQSFDGKLFSTIK